ncbi:MAG TPA: hypothetical protein VHE35_36750 [Kofleriaceae bacterium]|nr:hypothetical protein [Kofleriaceae bacterium]
MTFAPSIVSAALLAAALAAGCSRDSARDAPRTQPAAPSTSGAADAVAAFDHRTPLPLTAMMASHQKQEMRDHLRAVQEIAAAMAIDDFDAIAKAAARIGWSEQQAAMCKHMGAGAPGFADTGEQFHHVADGIAAAARAHDHAGVAKALDATLQTCVGCHDTYRQQIVDDAALARLTGAAPMEGDCPMHAQLKAGT